MSNSGSEFLLELFSEEIPAALQGWGVRELEKLICKSLKEAGLKHGETITSHYGPRRLTLVIRDVEAKSPDISQERKGPRVGAPEQALAGFLRGAGLDNIDQCEVQSNKKGDFYVAKIEQKGRAASEILSEAVTHAILNMPWPKSMRWGTGKLRWVRPLHSILCLLDGKVVPLEIEGIKSSNTTFGHRFMASKALKVGSFQDYEKQLTASFVLTNASAREQAILSEAQKLAKKAKLELVEDAALLAETAGLVEWPTVLMGDFDESFLSVPPEVLITSMKKHQKCFSLRAPQTGKLANNFLLVSNMIAEDKGKAITHGNERVIRARLSDAVFFWDQDRKVKLEDMAAKLDDIIFHDKLGSQGERVERIAALAKKLAPVIAADPDEAERAARLCKADLVSEMVGEFANLQGLMGRYYAEQQGESAAIAAACEEHYRPQGPSDAIPTDPVSIAVSLADKLDMLAGFWAIDEKPTGSKDPFALRRAALGTIRIVLENKIRVALFEQVNLALRAMIISMSPSHQSLNDYLISLDSPTDNAPRIEEIKQNIAFRMIFTDLDLQDDPNECVSVLCNYLENQIPEIKNKYVSELSAIDLASWEENWISANSIIHAWISGLTTDLLSFFADRLKVYLRDKGARHDLIDAVFSLGGQDDLLMIVKRVEALGSFLESDDGANLLAGIKRAANILRIEEKRDGKSYQKAPDEGLLTQKEEKQLFAAIEVMNEATDEALEAEDFTAAMTHLAKLRAPVDAFFEVVTVNDDDAALRENRLVLLAQIREATMKIADFSKIDG